MTGRALFSFLVFSFFLSCPIFTSAQAAKLAGQWEGTITVGGIDSEQGLRFELFLYREGKRLWGRSYVHLDEQRTIAMDVKGYLYEDKSVALRETAFGGATDNKLYPPFKRQYQLIFRRSFSDGSLNGYWQEVRVDSFHKKRRRGRIRLKKKRDKV